jgi:hypothetical protein
MAFARSKDERGQSLQQYLVIFGCGAKPEDFLGFQIELQEPGSEH